MSQSNAATQEREASRELLKRGVRRFSRVVRFRCGHRGNIGERNRSRCWHCVEVARKYPRRTK
jgi:hypothetical protein